MKWFSFILILVFSSCLSSDNDFKKAERNLKAMGYSNIENTGYDMFCCAEDDVFSTGFSAIDTEGNIVTGCACSGWVKGVTIRFN